MVLDLPAEQAREIDGLRRALGDPSLGRVRPHVTLVSPFNWRDDEMVAAERQLVRAASVVPAFQAILGPPAILAAPAAPAAPASTAGSSVVHLPVKDAGGELGRLRAELSSAVLLPRVRPGGRAYIPHVTLSTRVEPGLARAVVEALGGYVTEVGFAGVQLMMETAGRRWEPVADAALGGTASHRGGLEIAICVKQRFGPEALAFAGASAPSGFVVEARVPEQRLVGLAEARFAGKVCEIEGVCVLPGERGFGTGRRLLRAVLDEASRASMCQARAVVEDASAAEAFFSACGFSPRDFLVGWQPGHTYRSMYLALS
ncbi:MAG: GNAT family N-acetyltransferase [Acidimicrobiales bacterium]